MAITSKSEALEIYDKFNEIHRNGFCTREIGPRGGVKTSTQVWRFSGKPQEWKREPSRFRIPIKYGMYESWEVNQDNMGQFHTPDECPLNATSGVVNPKQDDINKRQIQEIMNLIKSVKDMSDKGLYLPALGDWNLTELLIGHYTKGKDENVCTVYELLYMQLLELKPDIDAQINAHNSKARIHAYANDIAADL